MRILLVEDERKLSAVIKRGLKEVHYAVDLADNGDDALFLAETNPMILSFLILCFLERMVLLFVGT